MSVITKREFLKIIWKGGLLLMVFQLTGCSKLKIIFRKITGRFKKAYQLPPDNERKTAVLPAGGENISLEKALNSRCSSDYDDNPRFFHWGMFDGNRKLSDSQIKQIVSHAKICRFTDQRIDVGIKGNIVSFHIVNTASGIQRDWVMVESGMQQQAVALVCAALGAGNVLLNKGKDGNKISEEDMITITMRLDAMKPSYYGSFWSAAAPRNESSWLDGNLPNPVRDGTVPLLTTLKNASIQRSGSKPATMQSLGQLLWAARGRTPHFYKSSPWGLTIPTWGGEQNISSLYVLSDTKLYKYSNWEKGRPTHSLLEIGPVGEGVGVKLKRIFPSSNSFILLGANETFARALWEIGYQFQNLLIQAYTIDIGYSAKILDEEERKVFVAMSIQYPVAILALQVSSFKF